MVETGIIPNHTRTKVQDLIERCERELLEIKASTAWNNGREEALVSHISNLKKIIEIE